MFDDSETGQLLVSDHQSAHATIAPELWSTLLKDQTTLRNIIWATDDYAELGSNYHPDCQIQADLLVYDGSPVIVERSRKPDPRLIHRARTKAEVATPSWMCNIQNNLIDSAWFNREDVFNVAVGKSWISTREKVIFPQSADRAWQDYVEEPRLEITCGEAPYLVSRYDAVTGRPIQLADRIGLLDRKMRIVEENTISSKQWSEWATKAFQSVYGYEFQGDNLLVARINLLRSYCDYHHRRFKENPTRGQLEQIAEIISWNLWQMDGTTHSPPSVDTAPGVEGTRKLRGASNGQVQTSLFAYAHVSEITECQIMDWKQEKQIRFCSLTER